MFNDAVFSEADFDSISRIGDSGKRRQAGKTGGGAPFHVSRQAQCWSVWGARIMEDGVGLQRMGHGDAGRFGIGFNSIYHLTDLPSFVSGQHLAIFGGCRAHQLHSGWVWSLLPYGR